MKRLPIAIASLLISTVSTAADIMTELATPSDKNNAIVISGEIVKGDYDKFMNALNKINNDKKVVVVLDGPGGSLDEAIGIGLEINKRRYSTLAYSGICASACAYIWLAGERAIIDIGKNAKIGFHAPYYIDKFGNKKSNNTASAILGGYLRDIGASYSIIGYATSVDGDSIQWLTESKSKELGLSAEFYKKESTTVAKQTPKTFKYTNWTLTVTVNELNQPHGSGLGQFKNNDTETATYVNGIRQGPGTYTFTNGDTIFYNYVDGRRHGEAKKYILSSGDQEIYTYVNGSLKSQVWTRFNKEGQFIASGIFN
jgi:hypothetical protein